eukprot:SAG11_NODE_484_length_9060_cov_7.118514_4_plen_195_part_00
MIELSKSQLLCPCFDSCVNFIEQLCHVSWYTTLPARYRYSDTRYLQYSSTYPGTQVRLYSCSCSYSCTAVPRYLGTGVYIHRLTRYGKPRGDYLLRWLDHAVSIWQAVFRRFCRLLTCVICSLMVRHNNCDIRVASASWGIFLALCRKPGSPIYSCGHGWARPSGWVLGGWSRRPPLLWYKSTLKPYRHGYSCI